tara:strand:+ start:621 stop:839 length:219 start_codon:yes stop_codon:yes gene_type:complete
MTLNGFLIGRGADVEFAASEVERADFSGVASLLVEIATERIVDVLSFSLRRYETGAEEYTQVMGNGSYFLFE